MPGDLILIFAYHFPPENAIGAGRPYRFYKYLRRLGYRCHVITAADVSSRADLAAETVPDPFVTGPRHKMGWQVERAARKLLLPGVTGTQWAFHAYRAALRLIERQRSSHVTIFSTFPPLGTHLAAYWLARRTGLPWVADYRDPLADNPIYSEWNRFRSALYSKVERVFVNAADVVIANTDTACAKLKADFPARANRIKLLWNGFDPEERLQARPAADAKNCLVSHVGELYGGRDISPILFSVRRLIDSGRLSLERVKVQLVGPMQDSSLPEPAFIRAAEQEGWLRLMPNRLPQAEAQAIVGSSGGLLLIQPQSILQVPGKLFEYLQIGCPILAYVPLNSPVERILEKSGVAFECVHPGSEPGELDRRVERFFRLAGSYRVPSEWFEQEFSAENQVSRLSAWIQGVRKPALQGTPERLWGQPSMQETEATQEIRR